MQTPLPSCVSLLGIDERKQITKQTKHTCSKRVSHSHHLVCRSCDPYESAMIEAAAMPWPLSRRGRDGPWTRPLLRATLFAVGSAGGTWRECGGRRGEASERHTDPTCFSAHRATWQGTEAAITPWRWAQGSGAALVGSGPFPTAEGRRPVQWMRPTNTCRGSPEWRDVAMITWEQRASLHPSAGKAPRRTRVAGPEGILDQSSDNSER